MQRALEMKTERNQLQQDLCQDGGALVIPGKMYEKFKNQQPTIWEIDHHRVSVKYTYVEQVFQVFTGVGCRLKGKEM